MAINRFSQSTAQSAFPKFTNLWDGTTATSAFDSLGSIYISSNTATITFSNIPQTYQHLHVRGIARNSSSTTQTSLLVRVNGDSTASNYRPRLLLTADGSSVASYRDGYGTYTGMMLGGMYGGSNGASYFSPNIYEFLDYSSTSKLKTAYGISGSDTNAASPPGYVSMVSSLWKNTNAITSLALSVYDGASFVAGTIFSLYGVK